MFDFASEMPKSQASEAPAEAEGGLQRAHPHIAAVVETNIKAIRAGRDAK